MECIRCGEHYSTKSNLLTHLRKAVSCEASKQDIPRNELITKLLEKKMNPPTILCDKCKKIFNTRQAKYKHLQKCKPVTQTVVQTVAQPVIQPVAQSVVQPVTQPVAQHVTHVNNCSINISGDVSNSQINQIYIPVNITINPHGLENNNYLTKELINDLFHKRVEGLIEILKKKHLNNVIPENHNLRKNVHSNNFIESYDGTEWNSRHKSYVLKDTFSNIGKDLVTFINNNKDINFDNLSDEQQIRVFNSFMENVGLPLDWSILFSNTSLMKDFIKNYPIDFSNYTKKKNLIYGIATESIYDFSKKSKECPF